MGQWIGNFVASAIIFRPAFSSAKESSLPGQMNLERNMTNSAHSFHSHISVH